MFFPYEVRITLLSRACTLETVYVRSWQRIKCRNLNLNVSHASLADVAVGCLQFQIQNFDIVCSPVWTSRDRCCDIPSRVSKMKWNPV